MPPHKPCRSGDKCGFLSHWPSPTLSFPLPNGRFPYIKIDWARQHFEIRTIHNGISDGTKSSFPRKRIGVNLASITPPFCKGGLGGFKATHWKSP